MTCPLDPEAAARPNGARLARARVTSRRARSSHRARERSRRAVLASRAFRSTLGNVTPRRRLGTDSGRDACARPIGMAGSKEEREQGGHRGGTTKFEDIFEVIDRDPDGKKFDRVSRYTCRSEFDAELAIASTPTAYRCAWDNDFRSRWRRR